MIKKIGLLMLFLVINDVDARVTKKNSTEQRVDALIKKYAQPVTKHSKEPAQNVSNYLKQLQKSTSIKPLKRASQPKKLQSQKPTTKAARAMSDFDTGGDDTKNPEETQWGQSDEVDKMLETLNPCLSIGADSLPEAASCDQVKSSPDGPPRYPNPKIYGAYCCQCLQDTKRPKWDAILSSPQYNPQSFLGACVGCCGVKNPSPCAYICDQLFPCPTDCADPNPKSKEACLLCSKNDACVKRCQSLSPSDIGGSTTSFIPQKDIWGDASRCKKLAATYCGDDTDCQNRFTAMCMNGGQTYYSCDNPDACRDLAKSLCNNDTQCTNTLVDTICTKDCLPLIQCGDQDSCQKIANVLCLSKDDAGNSVIDSDCQKKFMDACTDASCKGLGDIIAANVTCQNQCIDKAESKKFRDQFVQLAEDGIYGWCKRLGCTGDCPKDTTVGANCQSCLSGCQTMALAAQQQYAQCLKTSCKDTNDPACADACRAKYPVIDCRFYCLQKGITDCGYNMDQVAICDQLYPCTSSFKDCNYQEGACSSCQPGDEDCINGQKCLSHCTGQNDAFACNCQPSADSCYKNYICKTLANPPIRCK